MNNQHNHDHHGGGFMNGFLIGAIIGAAVVFFLFTEKGKKLLKTITEEGIEGFADLKDLVEEEMDDEEEEAYETTEENGDYEEPRHLTSIPHHAEHTHVEPIHVDHGDVYEHRPSKVKRFFRGIKRG